MNEKNKLPDGKRQEHNEKFKAQFTDYALAGLRKFDYAGVFQKIKDGDQTAWLAEIKLDGFQRSLFVRIWGSRDKAGSICRCGLLQGLRLKPERRSFDLVAITGGGERFHGIIELQDARLIINVFPETATGERKVYFCHLEVVRSDGSVGT